MPAHTSGSAALGWWGMVLTLVALGAIFALLIFSYFYLRYSNPVWPLDGIDPPGLMVPIISGVILLASAVPMSIAHRGIRRDDQRRLRLGLAMGFILGALFLALQLIDYARLDFAPQTNAYSAIFFTVAGFHVVLTLAGLGMNAFVQVQAWLGYFNRHRLLAVENTTLYWYALVFAWVVTAAILYGTPYLT